MWPKNLCPTMPCSHPRRGRVTRGQVEAAVERPGDAVLLQLDSERLAQLRAEDKQSFELTLPRPQGRAGVAPEWTTFELNGFLCTPML